MFGAVGQVEGMIHRIQEETGTNYSIFLTGGFSKLIGPRLKIHHTIDVDLTLKGIIYIYEYNELATLKQLNVYIVLFILFMLLFLTVSLERAVL